jgi:hypothetical protein
MINSVYVVGGQQRQLRSLLAGAQDWYEYQKGLILRVDLETGAAERCVEYVSPPEACAEHDPIILFKSGTIRDNKLYACTQTEVLIYTLPDFKRVGYISLPCFNDLHHVLPTPAGNLLVANTGLDMVLELTPEGRVVQTWGMLEGDPWERFSRDIDYRKGVSTKPHQSHPNHLFALGEEFWATRFVQKDAISLTRPDRRIEIGIERPHDGVPHNGRIYFTTVNGHIAIANQETLCVEEVIDLNQLHDEQTMLGWCRAILIDGERVLVGFSRLRPTKIRENVSWVKNRFKHFAPTRLACYDLARRRCLFEVSLEDYNLNAVFSIFPTV